MRAETYSTCTTWDRIFRSRSGWRRSQRRRFGRNHKFLVLVFVPYELLHFTPSIGLICVCGWWILPLIRIIGRVSLEVTSFFHTLGERKIMTHVSHECKSGTDLDLVL